MAASWLGTIFNFLAGGQYSSAPTPIADGSTGPLAIDSYGRLITISAGAGSAFNAGANAWKDPGALSTGQVVKALPGSLFLLMGSNEGASKQWIMIFNATALQSTGATPLYQVPVAPGGVVSFDFPRGRSFSSGIVWQASSTPGTLTTAGALNCWINAEYL